MNDKPSSWQGDLDRHNLVEDSVPAEPFALFADWYAAAQDCGLREPKAMTLATVDPDGQPSARIVLLKGFDAQGFRFYSNYQSRKGRALDGEPRAALVFWWEPLERQVRVTGQVSRLSAEDSEIYFHRRARASQLGVHASHQSRRLAGRAELEQRLAEVRARYAGCEVPCPDYWGGYILAPQTIEFWQARRSRLHDRLRYYLNEQNFWQIERLSP